MTLIGVLLLVLTPSFGLYQPSLLIRERELAVGARITTSLDEGVRIKGRYRTRRGEGRGGVHMTSFEKSTSSGDSCFFSGAFVGTIYIYICGTCGGCCVARVVASRKARKQEAL